MVKNKQKIPDFAPQNPENSTLLPNLVLRQLQFLFNVIYMIETDVSVCVLIGLDVYIGFRDQRLVKSKQKLANSSP